MNMTELYNILCEKQQLREEKWTEYMLCKDEIRKQDLLREYQFLDSECADLFLGKFLPQQDILLPF